MYNKNEIIEILHVLNMHGFTQGWNPTSAELNANVFTNIIGYTATSQVVNDDQDDKREFVTRITITVNTDRVEAVYNAIAVTESGRMTTVTCNKSCKCIGSEVSRMLLEITNDLCHPASYTIESIPRNYHPVVFGEVVSNEIRRDNSKKYNAGIKRN